MGPPDTVRDAEARAVARANLAGALVDAGNDLALAAGPAFSLIAAIVCLFVARHRPSFFWVTAAFTNATLILFPLTMDVLRAIKKAVPFSDEGNLAITITTSSAGRVIFLLGICAVFLLLTVVIARLYDFQRHRTAKVVNKDYHQLSQSEKGGAKRISQHLSDSSEEIDQG